MNKKKAKKIRQKAAKKRQRGIRKSVLMETKGAGEANGDVDVIVADVPQTTVGTEAAESALSRDELRRQLRSKLAKGSLCRTKGVFKGLGDSRGLQTRRPKHE